MGLGPILRAGLGRARTITQGVRRQVTPGRVAAGVTAGQIIGGLVGGGLAIQDAVSLYQSREAAAGQFQQQLIFPSDLIQDERSFYIGFKFEKYIKRSIDSSPFLRDEGTIRLPIPANLSDAMRVSYATESLSPAVGAALEGASRSGEMSSANGLVEGIGNIGGGYLAGAFGGLVNQAGGDAAKAGSAYFGIALNPYQTVLFKNPEFKSHSFSWRFAPRDEAESATIRDIARTFQYHMSPGISSLNGLFFSYPSMVRITLWPTADFLYRFKPCVVESVMFNYAPASSPSFFRSTQAPTVVTMTVQLKEIEYWTQNDFSAQRFGES